jgi:general secretion pathway protein G
MKQIMKSNSKAKGFTLLELMVVLVILGTLAGMVVPNLMGSQDDANKQAAAINIKAIETAMKMYKLKNNVYPSTEQGLEALVYQTDIEPIPRNFPEEGFLTQVPLDPWKNEYILVSPGDNGIYDIISMGPDMQADTEDDITNYDDKDQEEY